jgi:hypothetical protein
MASTSAYLTAVGTVEIRMLAGRIEFFDNARICIKIQFYIFHGKGVLK